MESRRLDGRRHLGCSVVLKQRRGAAARAGVELNCVCESGGEVGGGRGGEGEEREEGRRQAEAEEDAVYRSDYKRRGGGVDEEGSGCDEVGKKR